MLTQRAVVFFLLAFCLSGAYAGEPHSVRGGDTPDKSEKVTSRYYADLAEVHTKYGVYDRAEECLKKAIEMEQSTAVTSDYACRLARLYNEWGREDKAEAMFEFCLELTPDTSSIINRSRELARFYEVRGLYDKAEAVYRKALGRAHGPLARMLKQDLFRAANKAGKLEQIIAEKEKEAAGAPANVELLSDLGRLYCLSGDREKEQAAYRKILEINPANQKALLQLAIAQRSAGRTEEAVKTYQRLIEADPPARSRYVSEIVKLYIRAGEEEKAEAWEEELVGAKKDTPAARARLAKVYHDLKMYDKAIEYYLEAVEAATAPRQKQHYRLQLARAYLVADKPVEAEKECKQLVDNSTSPAVRHEAQAMLGRIRRLRGEGHELKKPRKIE